MNEHILNNWPVSLPSCGPQAKESELCWNSFFALGSNRSLDSTCNLCRTEPLEHLQIEGLGLWQEQWDWMLYIQLLKAWGTEVVTTCSTNNVWHLQELGADTDVDYTKEDFATVIPWDFDIGFDTVGYTNNYEVCPLRLLKRFHNDKYLSIRSPLLREINRWAVLLDSLITQLMTGIQVITQRLLHYQGFYRQLNSACFEEVRRLIEAGKITPQLSVAGTFSLEKISEMYKIVWQGLT